ncbi:MAG: SH3 domain-containing protein [Bacteroidota bacterium]
MIRFPLLLLALSLFASTPSAQIASLPPVDEGASDPSFIAFRSQLLAAAAARDTSAVLRAFAPTATISFGAEFSGADGVREVWLSGLVPREPGDDLWSALVETVSLGSTVRSGVTSAPYYFMGFPEGLDPFEHVIVVAEEVRVRSEPSLQGTVLGSLNYEVVPTAYSPEVNQVEADGYTWIPIRLATGERAWIAQRFVRSPLGLRAGFEKVNGRWTILYFVAGD